MRISPPNSLVLVTDSRGGEILASMNQSLISATDSCIAVGCRAEDDGETDIFLGTCSSVDPGERPIFEGQLSTPSRRIAVKTVLGATLVEASVSGTTTTVRIWANDPKEPDKIIVGIC